MQKMYYSIRQAAEMTNLEAHVLRFWETEFSELKPKKNRAGNRIYRDTDIDLILDIKRLLHDNRFTIEGARQEMKRLKGEKSLRKEGSKERVIIEVKQTLREILDLLG